MCLELWVGSYWLYQLGIKPTCRWQPASVKLTTLPIIASIQYSVSSHLFLIFQCFCFIPTACIYFPIVFHKDPQWDNLLEFFPDILLIFLDDRAIPAELLPYSESCFLP